MTSLACGGASEQDVLSESSSSGASGTTGTSGASTSSSSSSGGTTSGSPPPPQADAGTKETGAGACPREEEPNDEPSDATLLATSICGVLSPGSETDYLTFELPPGTKTMNLTFEGNIKMRVFVDGREPVEISPESNPKIPFVVGSPYVVQVRAHSGGDKVAYRVNLIRS